MMIAVSEKQMSILKSLRDRLATPHKGMGRLPRFLPTGIEVTSLSEVAALLNTDEKIAAVAVLQSKDASEALRKEAKDVFTGSGAGNLNVGIGTKPSRTEIIQRAHRYSEFDKPAHPKRRKKRKKTEDKSFPKDQKCKYCKNPAVKRIIHSEGMAYIPVCSDHLGKGKDDAANCVPSGGPNPSNIDAIHDIKVLHGQPDSDFGGLAIMLGIEPAEHFAIPGGLKPDQLHVTLVYYGESENHDGTDNQGDWVSGLKEIAESQEAFVARANGITRFTAESSDPEVEVRDPIVVNIDSPEIGKIREKVVAAFGAGASEHDYTPHMTLGYVDPEDDMPIRRYPAQPIMITGFILGWGNSHTFIPFQPIGSNTKEED